MSEISQIDCGYLAVVQAMAADRWQNAANKKDYIANVNSALALLQNQSGVNLVELKDSGKERKISLEWPVKCNVTTTDCSDDCSIDGEDATPECKEYEVSCLAETSFKIAERAYRNRTTDEQQAIANNMLLHMKAMDEKVAALILAGLDANAGVNVFTDSPGTVTGALTYIGASDWNEHIFSYLALVARMNKLNSPVVLDGKNLFRQFWEVMKDQANADGKGAANKFSSIGTPYFDPENIIGTYLGKTYIFDAGSAYFASKVWNPNGAANAIRKAGDRMIYSVPSMNLPGINYDVFTQESCVSNEYYKAFKLQLHGIFAVNPTPCDEDNTGILAFKCGVTP